MVTHVNNKIHESIQPNVNYSVDDNCYLDGGFFNDFSKKKQILEMFLNKMKKMYFFFFEIFSVLFLFANKKLNGSC